MKPLVTTRIALRALRKNKMRAGLTILGVVIGIAAVTTMVSIGQSAGQMIQGQFEAFGTNMIVVFPQRHRRGGIHHGREGAVSLTDDDARAVVEECPAVMAASPLVGSRAQVVYGNVNWKPDAFHGVGMDYLTVRNWPLERGGFFTERDIASAAKVCVIGKTLVAKLFQTTNPLNESIRINNIPFRVIGILEEKGANLDSNDQDNIVMAPYTTVAKRIRGSTFDNVDCVLASARSMARMNDAEKEVRQLLLERHRIPPGESADFEVMNLTEQAKAFAVVTGTMTALLAAIAGISLLVGGVGIMNIMLVSVTERTREIGIRLAVGARGRDILMQFLVEAVLLSGVGGLIGFSLGVGASMGAMTAINSFMSVEWPLVISVKAGIIAIIFAGAVGIFFGFYPALRASRLDPIDALRYE